MVVVKVQNDDRHIALQALLLINRERSLTVCDHVHHAGAKVEASKMRISTNSFDGLDCSFAHVRANGQNTVDGWIGLQRSCCPGFDLSRVIRNIDHVKIATKTCEVPFATVNKSSVERLLVQAKTVGHAFGFRTATGRFTRVTLGLTDVHQRAQFSR